MGIGIVAALHWAAVCVALGRVQWHGEGYNHLHALERVDAVLGDLRQQRQLDAVEEVHLLPSARRDCR